MGEKRKQASTFERSAVLWNPIWEKQMRSINNKVCVHTHTPDHKILNNEYPDILKDEIEILEFYKQK